MTSRALVKIKKIYLKYTNKTAYHKYHRKLWDEREIEDFRKGSLKIQHPDLNHPYKNITSFKHSGNCGDIIYSLPAAFELAKNGKVHYYLHLNQSTNYVNMYHPLGNIMLSEKMANLLTPLLIYQPQIEKVEKYSEQPLDYNLDEFRNYNFLLDRGSIVRWYFNVYGVSYNTAKPWLVAPKDEQYKDTLVIARSHRYRSPAVDYSFLKKYPNKIFLGIEEEYRDMLEALPDLEFKPVKDFLEMATIINSCKLFIGNQSFPFAIAEALKVNRLLEVYYKMPNVIVEGEGGNDFIYQPQFEHAVHRLYKPGV